MYSEEQPNQNPETVKVDNNQEEKSISQKEANLEETVVEKPVSHQVKDAEKKQIVELLHDRLPAEKPESVEKVAEPVPSEVKDAEKKQIVDLLHDRLPAEKPESVEKVEEPIPTTAAGVEVETTDTSAKANESSEQKSQISESDRKAIVLLLSDSKEKTAKAAEIVEEVDETIDYDSLNKQELVELLEEVVQEKNIFKIRNKVAKIKTAFHHHNKEELDKEKELFVAEGGNIDDYSHSDDPLEQRYNAAFSIYRQSKARYGQELEKEKQENLQLKHTILEELKELIGSEETLKKTYDEFKHLQDRWKEIGMVPAGDLNNLWQNYHFLVEKFFDKVRINKELRDLDLKKNLEHKIELCEKAEELFVEKSVIRSFKLLQKYHDEWREVGPVPMDKKDELWDRFKTATDKINERRREHYKVIQGEQEKNFEAKEALCEKAEEIAAETENNFKGWQKKTDQINELFKVWKTIGRAPKNKNDEVWARFRAAMDSFYSNRRDFLGQLKEQQTNNLNLKIDLCVKAESLAESTDWKHTTQELINLQKEWKNIGPAPKRQSDKIWKRFRVACDTFFNNKSSHFKNLHSVEDENLKAKESLIKEISEFKDSKDKEANLNALKSFQRKWMDLGYVPFKEKERIQNEYRASIDQLIDKMDINKMDITKSGFKNKVEIMKNDPDAKWRLSKERGSISMRIKKIQEDINLWENNITFFASSKQSDLLKKEFEVKIEKAKSEVNAMKAKLRILDED